MLAISLKDYHLPDEYVDSAISVDVKTSESQDLPTVRDILTSILPVNWSPSNKEDAKEDPHGMNDLNECRLTDDDASVLCYYDDDSDTTGSEGPKNLLGYIVPIRWLRCNDDSTKRLSEKRSVGSNVVLKECHLPDEYVDAMVSYDYGGSEVSSPVEYPIGCVITLPWLESNDSTTKKHRPFMNEIFLSDCHLPDDYVDVVLASFATDQNERSDDLSAMNVKRKCEETTSAEPSPSPDGSMEGLAKIMSTDPKANESSRDSKLAWVLADEASKAKKDDSYAPKKIPVIGVAVGDNPVDALVPSVKVSRGALRRRMSAQSVSWSSQ
jgi:hypothetical protein